MWMIIGLLCFGGGLIGLGYLFCLLAIQPKTFTHEAALKREVEKGYITEENFLNLDKEEVLIASKWGYDIYGLWIPVTDSTKTMIFVHGITYTLHGSVKYMDLFRRMGYNILIYDQRNHGKSGGRYTTFGHFEKADLKNCVDFILERVPDNTWLGTHGESLGGATVLLHAAIDPRVDAVIADCSYDTVKGILAYRLQADYKLKGLLLLPIANIFSKWLTGVQFFDISPLEAVQQIHCPVLFIHGLADAFTPCTMSENLFAHKKQGKRMLYLVPEAGHARSFVTDPQGYEHSVMQFINACNDN